MNDYMIVIGIAITVICFGLIFAGTVINNKSQEIKFETDYKARVDAIPPPAPLPVVAPKDDMLVVEKLSDIRSIDLRGLESSVVSELLHIADSKLVKSGIPDHGLETSRFAGNIVLESLEYKTTSISRDMPNSCKQDVQYFYTYRVEQSLRYGENNSEAFVAHSRITMAPGGIYCQPELWDWGYQTILVKLDRKDLLQVLKNFALFIGHYSFADNGSDTTFSSMKALNLGYEPDSLVKRYMPSFSTTLDNVVVRNFGYSSELASHFISMNVFHKRHFLAKDAVCTWPMVNLTQDIVNEFIAFKDRYSGNGDFHTASSLEIYSTNHGFSHIELSHKNADGVENIIIFSDRLSAFNRRGTPVDDHTHRGVAHHLFNGYGAPTDVGRKVLLLDDQRKITWLYNGAIATEDQPQL